jgi:hypothetical protein
LVVHRFLFRADGIRFVSKRSQILTSGVGSLL